MSEGKKSSAHEAQQQQNVNTKQMYTELIKCERSRDFERGVKAANKSKYN